MRTIPGYKFLSCIYKNSLSKIYRAIRISDGYPVIVKMSLKKGLYQEQIARFRHEFKIVQQINSSYVIRYLELKQDKNYGAALVMKDDKLVSLVSMIPPQGFSNREFLGIAIQIVQGLQDIHSANIIHNNISPYNIFIQPLTKMIKINNFNRAVSLTQHIPFIALEKEALGYISPEQTGRINRSVDYRSDFYSLGIVFYQLLCEKLPFAAEDILGFVYQHLAKQPQPPHDFNSNIALAISMVVMKLLEKEAENRYQSCEGILYDLTYCLSNLNKVGIIPEFEVGLQDFSSQLILSQRLYGREKEIKLLEQTFERVSRGKREVVMVAGQAGVGKSKLICELQKSIALKNGFFLSGKFDQLNKNVAYHALTQAFDNFIKRLLIEDEENIAQWKSRLVTALVAQGQLITKIIPSLAALISEPSTADITDISQAKNVFNVAFEEFVSVFANAAHPLVIFLDDLQWADQSTLELMTYLMQQPKLSHLFWIGAYRETEVTDLHPAMQAVVELQAAQLNVQILKLAPLEIESLSQWVADSLHMSIADVTPLAELIHQKTIGNPFFLKTFFQSLYDQQLLTFSRQHWQWNIDKIRLHPATENVVALMTYQIQQLPLDTQKILSTASCLGNRVLLTTLKIALAKPQQVIITTIQPALNIGILIQINGSICFAHDRVQEAAYNLLEKSEKSQMHYTIGKRLQHYLITKEVELFDVVAQFNSAHAVVTNEVERLDYFRLNLEASQKAKQATAYEAALNYLHACKTWKNLKNLWRIDYSLSFNFHKELAEMEYICGHLNESQKIIVEMQSYLRTKLDEVEIYHLLIIQKIMQGQQREAIVLGAKALQILGSSLPLDNPFEFTQRAMPLIQKRLAGISFSSLLDASLVVDSEKKAIFKILSDLYSACYQIGSDLLPAIVLMTIDLSLTHGHAPESCLAYVGYGVLLCINFQEYKLGYEFGNFAIQLSEKLHSPIQHSHSIISMCGGIYAWSKPIQNLEDLYRLAYKESLACGDIEYAGYCGERIKDLFDQGMQMSKVQEEILTVLEFVRRTKTKGVMPSMMLGYRRIIANLMGETIGETDFDYTIMSEADYIKDCQKSAQDLSLGMYYLRKAQVLYLYGYIEQAIQQLDLTRSKLVCMRGFYETAIFNWYSSLTYLALLPTVTSNEQQQAYIQRIMQNQQQMSIWKDNCPENFAHKYLIIAAELARIKKEYTQAESLYRETIDLAGKHEFIHEKALSAELAAKYWLQQGNPEVAKDYLNIAFSSYKQWGARRKLMQLQTHYNYLLKISVSPGWSDLSEVILTKSNVNLSSILKASQAISSEIELPKLLHKIMEIIIKNAGAQQGAVLLIEADENIFVQAEYTIDGAITTLQKIPLAEWSNGAHTIIQNVKKLRQSVLVGNAIVNDKFSFDPYITRTQVKSILCVPILHQTKLRAILYLENNLMTDAFTAEQEQILSSLTISMAIALENAYFFKEKIAHERQLAEQAIRTQIAEESLHAVTHDLKVALEASKAGTWSMSIDTQELIWDETCYVLYGLKPGEFGGSLQAARAVVHPEDYQSLVEYIKECIEKNQPLHREYRIIWPDGSQHVLSSHGSVYHDTKGKPIKLAGVTLDVTQHYQLLEEARIKEAEKKEEFSRAMYAICHDLRNPLTGLTGGVVLVREALEELKILFEKQEKQLFNWTTIIDKFLREIQEPLLTADICTKQLKEVIDDILDYYKLEQGKAEFIEKPFDLQNTLATLLKSSTPQIKEKNLELKFELPDQTLFKGDEIQLKRILINLLTNAIKFTHQGSIKIKAAVKPLSNAEIELVFSVADTGIGIAETELPHLFERFSEASRHTVRAYGGTGLGLAISKQLVEKMGGDIDVESQVGKGSKFSFTIKCKNLTEEEKIKWEAESKQAKESLMLEPESSELKTIGNGKTILIVEDNVINQQILINYLKKAGYSYQIANNGQEAVEKFKQFKFDAILMDIEMPVMSGIEATRKIRELEQTLNYFTPVIALSGYGDQKHKDEAVQAGMDDYMLKPYSPREVYGFLEKHIGPRGALTVSSEVEAVKPSRNKRRRDTHNRKVAQYIVKHAIETTLGRWRTYGCAFIPEDEQQDAVDIIVSVFDHKIQPHEQSELKRILSATIHLQSAWYACFNRMYGIATDELTRQLQTMHHQKELHIYALQA